MTAARIHADEYINSEQNAAVIAVSLLCGQQTTMTPPPRNRRELRDLARSTRS